MEGAHEINHSWQCFCYTIFRSKGSSPRISKLFAAGRKRDSGNRDRLKRLGLHCYFSRNILEQKMKKNRITVTIDSDIEKWLRPEANSTGKSLSHLIRICLREFHDLRPNRFSTSDKARAPSEQTWRIPAERLEKRQP